MLEAALLALAAQAMQVEAVPKRLPPVDRCRDADFIEFRSELRSAIARKDEDALLGLLAEDVLVDFGGGQGRLAFAEAWEIGAEADSRVWEELKQALEYGCAPAGDALVSPSFVAQAPPGIDAFETVIAIPLTRLKTEKSNFAPGLANLDWHVASVTDDSDADWLGVTLADGRRGYVRRNQVIQLLDYRLTFEKRDGKWAIAAFVAGD